MEHWQYFNTLWFLLYVYLFVYIFKLQNLISFNSKYVALSFKTLFCFSPNIKQKLNTFQSLSFVYFLLLINSNCLWNSLRKTFQPLWSRLKKTFWATLSKSRNKPRYEHLWYDFPSANLGDFFSSLFFLGLVLFNV